MEHYNRLSPQVAELLAILAEECGEVTQRVGKILRHGIRVNPYKESDQSEGKLNTAYLEEELADLLTIAGLLAGLKVLDMDRINSLIKPKIEKLRRPDILHHSTLLTPRPCGRCGSIDRIQRGLDDTEVSVECVDERACNDQVMQNQEDERLRRKLAMWEENDAPLLT